jgi:thioredoxin 1
LIVNAMSRGRVCRPALRLRKLFSTDASKIISIDTPKQYREVIETAEDGSVSYFTAAWCGPCRAIAPAMEKLSIAFPRIAIAKLDIDKDELLEVSQENEVVSVPTFVFRRKQEVILKFSGADIKQLQAGLELLANP